MSKIDSLSWKVWQFLKEKNCLFKGVKFILATSGGSDSVAMAHLFFAVKKKIDFEVKLVYFHHNLRNSSDKEQIFVKKLAKKLNFDYCNFQSKELKIPSLQNKARKWRIKELEKLRKKENFDFIVLAHHLDDLAETQIWRILRGVSLFDLATIKPVDNYFLRPLLYFSKKELQTYLLKIKQDWLEDESNLSLDYTRNYIRHKIIPPMKNIFSPNYQDTFLKKMLSLHQESNQLNQIYQSQVSLDNNNFLFYEKIQSLPELFAKKLIYDFLLAHKIKDILRVQVENIYQLVAKNQGGWKLAVGKKFFCIGDKNKIMLKKF